MGNGCAWVAERERLNSDESRGGSCFMVRSACEINVLGQRSKVRALELELELRNDDRS